MPTPTQTQPNQNPPEEPQIVSPVVQPKKSSSMSVFVTIFVIILLGLVAYFYNQNQQLKSLQIQPVPSTDTVMEEDPTANWQTYTSQAGYSLKYPPTLISEVRETGFIVFLEDSENPSSVFFSLDERGNETVETKKTFQLQNLESPKFSTLPNLPPGSFVVEGKIKTGMGQGSLLKSAYLDLNGKALSISCDIYQNCFSTIDQILSTFKFSGTNNQNGFLNKTLKYLTLTATVPEDWTISEKNVRPAEANSGQAGKTCADYDIISSDQTATLMIQSICEFTDGGSSPLPSDSVTVKNDSNGTIIRYLSQNKYIYSTAFLTDDPVHSEPPIVSFKLSENNLFFTRISFVSTNTLNLQEQLNTADTIVASMK